MVKLPVVGAIELIKLLTKLGYEKVRQKGSHIRMRKITSLGEHGVTVPNHKEISKGTLNDILSKASLWNSIPKEKLVEMLSE